MMDQIKSWMRELGRTSAPSLLMAFCMLASYEMGHADVALWFILIPMVFGGFALGMIADRAENRAGKEWAGKFWSLIQSDHTVEFTVTHKTSQQP